MSGPMSVSMTIRLIDEASAGAKSLTATMRDLKAAGENVNAATQGRGAAWDAEQGAVQGVIAKVGELKAATAEASAPIQGAVSKLQEESQAVEGLIGKMEALKAATAEASAAGGEGVAGSGPGSGRIIGKYGWDGEKFNRQPGATGQRASDWVEEQKGSQDAQPKATQAGGGVVDSLIGFAEMATGIKLLRGSYEQASEAEEHRIGMRVAGIPPQEASAISQAAEGLSRETAFSRNEIVDLARDARTVLGSTHHAIDAMPDIVSLATIAEAKRHGEGLQGIISLLKGMETSGATTSPEKFHGLADSLAKVTNVFGKTIDFTAWGQFFKYGGTASQHMSPEFIEQKLPHLIQELGGASAGTMFQSMQRAIVGGRIDPSAIREMRRFDLLDETKVHAEHGREKLDAGAIRYADQFMRDPSAWVTQHLKPAMDNMNMSEEERAHALGTMFSNRVSERGMSILENQDANIEKDAEQIRAAQGVSAGPVLTRQDPHLASRAADARIKDLEQKAGEPVIGAIVSTQNAFSAGLGRVTETLSKIPGAATAFEGALIAGAGYMGWKTWEKGALNTAKEVLKAPESLIRNLAIGDLTKGLGAGLRGGALGLGVDVVGGWAVQHAAAGLMGISMEEQRRRTEEADRLYGWHLLGSAKAAEAPTHGGASGSWEDQPRPSASKIPDLPVTATVMAAVDAAMRAHEAAQPRPVPTAAQVPQTITNNEQKYITAPITVSAPITINATLTNTTPGAIANTVAGAVAAGVKAGSAAAHDGTETR